MYMGSKLLSQFENTMTNIYFILYISLCIDLAIIIFEALLFIFNNLRFRAFFGFNPTSHIPIIDILVGSFDTIHRAIYPFKWKFYEYKFAFSFILYGIIYGVCGFIYVVNRGIIELVKLLRKALKPIRKGVKKIGVKIPNIPYNCIPIPRYIESHYRLFFGQPHKKCKLRKNRRKHSYPGINISIISNFNKGLKSGVSTISNIAPILLWCFLAILFFFWFIYKILSKHFTTYEIPEDILNR